MRPQTELNLLSIKNNIPISVTFELTYRCCYYCQHCYIPETHQLKKVKKELDIKQVDRILKELKNNGSIFLVLTGGEPFLRNDLAQICNLAVKYNFETRIFTSLYPVNEKVLQDIKLTGIKWLEVSFYGRKKTYEFITGIKNSFDRVIENLKIAKKLGFKIKIKTPLMKVNYKDISWLNKFCQKNNFILNIDPNLTPLNNGSCDNLKLKANKIQLLKLFKTEYFKAEKNPDPMININFPVCVAARNVISIDPYGNIYSCLQLPVKIGNILNQPFKYIWNSDKIKKLREYLNKYPLKCRNCKYFNSCSRCPGISYIYSKNIDYIYSDACYMAKLNRIH